ncbi:MAG: UPF0149 family protein [Candidatus Electryonea clarkiae]|nr:UPF0149 family protein [Candidatus Electryonea clarkiae]MDP8287151.1 UPF0149 family protein [Candidatus Electryonea clarkiae]
MKRTISEADLKELEEFLVSDKTPGECMDISTLHGFFTCLAIGPETILPSQWLPGLWGETANDEMNWDSEDEANHIISLLMALYNSIIQIFEMDPYSFAPIFYKNKKGIVLIDDWCWGFMQCVDITSDSWKPLFDSKEYKEIITPIFLNGTEEGLEIIDKTDELDEFSNKELVAMIPEAAIMINEFWLPYRKANVPDISKAKSDTVGRNDPCPCGSGEKFKRCCMN